jgi:ectoine hydroxylase-related dioxygenase (phytanoyl-CoA dioxygenase family)
MISKEEKNKLKRDGYLIIKNFINSDKVVYLRKALRNFNRQETLANKKLNYFSVNNKIIKIMNNLLGGKIYYPFLSMAVNNMYQTQKKKSLIHNDVRFEDFNFDKDYNIYNVGIYLQDHINCSGGLKVRPGSHKKIIIEGENYLKKILLFCKTLVRKPSNVSYFQILRTLLPYKSINLKINAGDLVIWNLRLHHSGNNIRVKFLKNLSFSTYLENIIPNFIILKNSLDRFAILTVYIGKGAYKNKYINEQVKRPQHVEFWKNSKIDLKILQKKIKNKKIELVPQIKKIIASKQYFL